VKQHITKYPKVNLIELLPLQQKFLLVRCTSCYGTLSKRQLQNTEQEAQLSLG